MSSEGIDINLTGLVYGGEFSLQPIELLLNMYPNEEYHTNNVELRIDIDQLEKVRLICKYFTSITNCTFEMGKTSIPPYPPSYSNAEYIEKLLEIPSIRDHLETVNLNSLELKYDLSSLKNFRHLKSLELSSCKISLNQLISSLDTIQPSKVILRSTPYGHHIPILSIDPLYTYLFNNTSITSFSDFNYFCVRSRRILIDLLNHNKTLIDICMTNLTKEELSSQLTIQNSVLQKLYVDSLIESYFIRWNTLSNLKSISFLEFSSDEVKLLENYHYHHLETLKISTLQDESCLVYLLRLNLSFSILIIEKYKSTTPLGNNEILEALQFNRNLKNLTCSCTLDITFLTNLLSITSPIAIKHLTINRDYVKNSNVLQALIGNKYLEHIGFNKRTGENYNNEKNDDFDSIMNLLENNHYLSSIRYTTFETHNTTNDQLEKLSKILDSNYNITKLNIFRVSQFKNIKTIFNNKMIDY
ncbi:hypothetical protein DLAC_08835 [Tieghemostelium lacteum]|uniref:Uncharacterized protein n=1 Tax=Tieghemostelium lacteum TaxID=361077 RepID=A0A151Z8T6_TIELA|nr:hypothetical protein DLAC_08835 [Tieghemostelium lacteum]|eukprot:KYQ90234.1 hypothetical protein DLAC_08835 [Tieghemostelium lacteum]